MPADTPLSLPPAPILVYTDVEKWQARTNRGGGGGASTDGLRCAMCDSAPAAAIAAAAQGTDAAPIAADGQASAAAAAACHGCWHCAACLRAKPQAFVGRHLGMMLPEDAFVKQLRRATLASGHVASTAAAAAAVGTARKVQGARVDAYDSVSRRHRVIFAADGRWQFVNLAGAAISDWDTPPAAAAAATTAGTADNTAGGESAPAAMDVADGSGAVGGGGGGIGDGDGGGGKGSVSGRKRGAQTANTPRARAPDKRRKRS